MWIKFVDTAYKWRSEDNYWELILPFTWSLGLNSEPQA